jgi:hypothetical protein
MSSVGKFLDKNLPDWVAGYLERKFPDYLYAVGIRETRVRLWVQNLITELVKLGFLAVTIGLGYILGLYFLRGGWFLFVDTMVGIRYIGGVDAAGAARISQVLSLDFMEFASTVLLLTIVTCLKVGAVSQLTLLRRYFYVARPLLIKLTWAVLVCALVAGQLAELYPMEFHFSFWLCFLPTIGILSPALASSGKLLPELNLLLFLENRRKKREVRDLKDDINRIMEAEDIGNEMDRPF